MTEIKGMTALKSAFKDLGTQAQRNKPIALKLVANTYKNDVQAIAPYDTGTLRRSIHVEEVSSDMMLVGTDLPYARRLEYGFYQGDGFTGGVDKLGRKYHQLPRPYFRPPMDNNFDKYQKIYLTAMGDIFA
jgi:hypothetical protein